MFKKALPILLAFSSATVFANAPKPKYGPEITLLSVSHAHIQRTKASDYWALSPYYAAQQDGRSCSVASVAMLVNAARVGKKLTADDELVTQKKLLEQVKGDVGKTWKKGVGDGGHGVTLDQLGEITEASLKAYGLEVAKLEVVHADDTSAATQKKLHEALTANEASAKDFILANFIQGKYTGDADVGHIAPVAAYDAATKRVLIFDPDREWYEPYWVSEKTFLDGLATQDQESDKSRGYIWVRLK